MEGITFLGSISGVMELFKIVSGAISNLFK